MWSPAQFEACSGFGCGRVSGWLQTETGEVNVLNCCVFDVIYGCENLCYQFGKGRGDVGQGPDGLVWTYSSVCDKKYSMAYDSLV